MGNYSSKTALLIVDLQLDFCPGGALPVSGGDLIIPTINHLLAYGKKHGWFLIFSRDWHPSDHSSFQQQKGPWPSHCVKNSNGSKFHPKLRVPGDALIISKATEPDRDAYSAFQGTNLTGRLRQKDIENLFICGLATDYCVKATAVDALQEGYAVYIITDAVKGVNLSPEDDKRALDEMARQGAELISSKELFME